MKKRMLVGITAVAILIPSAVKSEKIIRLK